MCKKTTIYKNLTHGDWVICTNCGKMMLVPCGADQCPECTCEGSLQWVDEEKQEADIDEVGETEYKDKELELQDYVSVDTLAIEYPDEYKRLEEHLAWDKKESPLSRKEIIESKVLIGVDLMEIKGILGYWWVCSNSYINTFTRSGVHTFNRVGHGRLEIYTQFGQDNKGKYSNLVVDVR